MQKKRVPNIMASIKERNADFIPFALSANGALGPAANAFLKMVFNHVKIAREFSMRFGKNIEFRILRMSLV